jgi:predicted phosphodiesterase
VAWVFSHYAYHSLKDVRPRLKGNKLKAFQHLTKKERRILVIGDLHEPFCLDGYLAFCQDTYAKWNCNQVIFIGDLVDSHANSYHESDPDGMSAGDELHEAKKRIAKWYKAFPVANCIIGNHDRIVSRKAFTAGIPAEWIRNYNEVLNTPKWNWVERIVYDDVQYVHGEGGQSSTKCKNDMMSTVQGHIHTKAECTWHVGRNFKVFGMQVGCGVNHESYAAAYAKNFKKQAIGCGVVIGGHTAINILMPLGKK